MNDDRNSWTRYYESTLSSRREPRREPRVVQSEKQAPMVLRGAEKQIAEDNAQFRRYRRAKAAEYKAAIEKEPGLRLLRDILKHLDMVEPLLVLVNAIDWQEIDIETRQAALSMIDDAIIRLREQNGLAPFDDSIFDEEPTVFEICKAKLGVV